MSKGTNGAKKFFHRHKVLSVFLLIVLVVVFITAYSLREKAPTYDFSTVERRDIKQEVSVTGRVKPAADVDLAFEKGGRVSRIYVDVGDHVEDGSLLAVLASSDVLASVDEAKARLAAEEAKLRQLEEGTRSEEINVQKNKLESSKVALSNASKTLAVSMADAYTKADDAIRNRADKFFLNPRTSDPKLTFTVSDSSLQNDLELRRVSIEATFVAWAADQSPANTSSAETVKSRLGQVRDLLDKAALALSTASPSASVSQTTIDGYKTDVSTARTNINTALSALDTAEQAFRAAESNVTLEESSLALKEAPTDPDVVSAQEAVVAQAQAAVRSAQAEAAKFTLRSPIAGTITKQDTKAGEIVSPNTPVISVISQANLQIEAFIPEADIAKVHIGDEASTTLDAYGDGVVFLAKVVSVDPAETLFEGVATYKTTFQFKENDDRIKPGMTANIDILTEEKEGVLALPQRSLTRKESGTFANILENAVLREIPIETGLRGSDGYVEILSGLAEGQQVVVLTR